MESAVTGLFVVLALGGGLMAAVSRAVLHAIIGLGISLLGVAGLFLLLGSPFVAAMQLLIYLGGITVAIVFAMMLSDAMSQPPPRRTGLKTAFAAIAALLFGAGVWRVLDGTTFPAAAPAPESAWQVGAIGHALLGRYNLVFEALSVVLLAAVMGAILVARRPPEPPSGEGAP